MSKKWIYLRYLIALLALLGSALLGSGTAAAAHNELIGSDPPDGAEVATSPARVSLTFNLPVQRGFSTVTVTGPNGIQWPAGPSVEAGAVVSAPVPALGPAGQYTIAYQVLSADGHPMRGAVRFTLTAPGTGAPGPAAAAGPPPIADQSSIAPSTNAARSESNSSSVWPWLAGAGVLLVGGVAVALRVARSR